MYLLLVAGCHVEDHRCGKYSGPADVLVGYVHAHQVHTAYKRRHDECSDQRPDDLTDAACSRYTAHKSRSDGSDLRQLTFDPTMDWRSVWSPDGGWILFLSERDGNREVYRMRRDGKDLARLTNDLGVDCGVDW